MRVSYKLIITVFFLLYLLPLAVAGFFVQAKIKERQITLQIFLQNFIDVDRKIIDQRTNLRDVQPEVRNFLLAGNFLKSSLDSLKRNLSDAERETQEFFQRYEEIYAAGKNVFIQNVLRENQELSLLDEEVSTVLTINRKIKDYFDEIEIYIAGVEIKGSEQETLLPFFEKIDSARSTLFQSFDQLADIRYIFTQRAIFSISGENDRQKGFFTALFLSLFGFAFVVSILEYFYIHKPFKDIIFFLADLARGKRGQRLYFGTPVKEIKESEDVINEIVDKAEKHEKEKRPNPKKTDSFAP